MRTKRIKLYKFEELSAEAQQNAIENYQKFAYERLDLDFFAEDAEEYLSTVGFNNAKLRYSLAHCQGDGLSFKADIDLSYFLDLFAPSLTPYRKAVLLYYLTSSCEANTGRYAYAHRNDIDINLETWVREYKNLKEFTEKLETFVSNCYIDECKKLERQGYDEIEYQQSEEFAKESILANEYEFLSDGTQY